MSDHFFKIGDSYGIMSLANIFRFGGFTFEYHNYLGPMKLRKKDLEPWNNTGQGGRKFFTVIDKFEKLSKKEKEKYRIYG